MTDRRACLALLGAVGFAGAIAPINVAKAARRPFDPRSGQYMFTRRLVRGLPDGKAIIVARSFAVDLSAQANGFRLDGQQHSVEVDAPPPLAALAELERNRREVNSFPLELDHDGLIVGAPQPTASPMTTAAVKVALEQLALNGPQKASATNADFLKYIQTATAEILSRFPRDLFAPIAGPISQTREMALPDGSSGSVTVDYSAEANPETGLLVHAARHVTTHLAGSSRYASESWTLAPV